MPSQGTERVWFLTNCGGSRSGWGARYGWAQETRQNPDVLGTRTHVRRAFVERSEYAPSMRAGVALGLLAGLGAGFGLGWWSRGGEEPAEPTLLAEGGDPQTAGTRTALAVEEASDRGTISLTGPASTEAQTSGRPSPHPDALRLQGHGGPASYQENGWARAALLRKYRELSKGSPFPPEDVEAQVERLAATLTDAALQRTADAWAGAMAHDVHAREALRAAEGTLADPVLARFQSLGQRVSTSLAPKPAHPHPQRSREPLDIDAPGKGRLAGLWFMRGGVIPRNHDLCVETIEVEVRGTSDSRQGVRVASIELPNGAIQVLCAGSTQSLRYEGSVCVREGDEDDLKVLFDNDAMCEVRLAGRLIPVGRERTAWRPFRATQARGDGYLTGETLLFQVVADRGGGSVYFDGSDDGRFDVRSDRSVWDEGGALADLKSSSVHVEGAGVPPPGKAFEITRVTWRGRRTQNSHSTLEIRVGETQILSLPDRSREAAMARERSRRDGQAEERVEGSWTGRVPVGGATRVRDALEIAATHFAMLELRVEGSLVDAPER